MKTDVYQILAAEFNEFFKTKPALMMFHDSNFAPDRIPDGDIKISSMFCMHRLSQVEQVADPSSKEKRLKGTELVRRATLSHGKTNAKLLEAASASAAFKRAFPDFTDYKSGVSRDPYRVSRNKQQDQLQGSSLLRALRGDIFADVCGSCPLSSLNVVGIASHIIFLFLNFESKLREAHHPLWIDTYKNPPPQVRRQKRVALVVAVMTSEDDSVPKILAEVFEELRVGLLALILWDDLKVEDAGIEPPEDGDELPVDKCAIV